MNTIVLVKQVPDISDLRPDAWDTKKGTLRRGVLDSILNPLDLHALTLAADLRKDGEKLIALTMGPPQAREMLQDCLARGADEAVLLSDMLFAGADTCATAIALAYGVKRAAEKFGLGNEYVIVAGMQSVDGDTAQVPPQLAEELDIEQIAYAEAVELVDGDGLRVRRIGPHGKELVTPLALPVLITATASTEPLYRSFHRARTSLKKEIQTWKAADLGLEAGELGLKGSRTQVVKIFSPEETRTTQCRMLDDSSLAELPECLREAWNGGGERKTEERGPDYDLDGRDPEFTGEVWVFAEQEEGKLHSVSLELLGKARELAGPLGERVGAVLLGYDVRGLAPELIAHGADRVYVADHPLLDEFLPMPYKKVLVEAVLKYNPQILLAGATPLGRELAPRVAYACQAGLTADCTVLEIGDIVRNKKTKVGVLCQTRPALGGNIMATIVTKNSPLQMATVRPAVMNAIPADADRKGEIVDLPVKLTEADVKSRVLSRESLPPGSNLAEAEIIVAGGRGLGGKDAFGRTIPPLAKALGELLGGSHEIGASRPAVEEGFIGHQHQVGQTGQTVQPRIYVAVAISGAIQHTSGMQNSGAILAINKDPKAPIFRYADFGIVGEYETVIPRLLEILQPNN